QGEGVRSILWRRRAVVVRDPAEVSRLQAVLVYDSFLDGVEPDPANDIGTVEVPPVQRDQQHQPARLLLWLEPEEVHQGIAAEEVPTAGLLDALSTRPTVERQLAGQAVPVDPDDERCDPVISLHLLGQRLHVPPDFLPR